MRAGTPTGVVRPCINLGPRPYPATGMSTRKWMKLPVSLIPFTGLVFLQEHLSLQSILDCCHGLITSHSGDPVSHVVLFEGVRYLEDGHHRTVTAYCRGQSHFPARVLEL